MSQTEHVRSKSLLGTIKSEKRLALLDSPNTMNEGMNYERWIATFFSCLIVVSTQVEARSRSRATPEEQIQACLSNKEGMAITLRSTLNQRKNPLAENVAATDWTKYCGCYVPKAQALENSHPKGNLPRDVYQKLVADLGDAAVACASSSIPTGQPIRPVSPTASLDPRFEPTLKNCQSRPKGYLANLKIHLKTQKSPRAERVDQISPEKYCGCYVNSLRLRLGDELALKVLTFPPANRDEKEILRVAQAKNETFDFCAAEQIPF